MKKLFNSNQSKGDPIADEHTLLLALAQEARPLAERGLPSNGQSITPYITAITSGYNELVAKYVTSQIAATSQKSADFYQTSLKEKTVRLTEQRTELREQLQRANMHKASLPTDTAYGKSILLRSGIITLSLLESSYTISSMMMFSRGSNLKTVITAIGLAVLFIILPEGLAWLVRKTEGLANKWIIRSAIFLVVIAAFTVFGLLRNNYLIHYSDTTLQQASPMSGAEGLHVWYYVILSILFLLCTTYLSLLIPSSSQLINGKNERKASSEIHSLEARILQIENDLNRIPEESVASESSRQERIAQARANYHRINSLYGQNVGEWKSINLKFRQSEAPACFFEPLPVLENPFSHN